MPRYQIEFKDGDTCASYKYFTAEENIEEAAIQTANEVVAKWKSGMRAFGVLSLPRTLNVREYDTEKKCVKRGGHKFKLKLGYAKRKRIETWYKANK